MPTGIYIIKNLINGKLYIGSAVNIKKRIYEHTWALKKNCHDNIHLQRAWNKNGEKAFSFETYLICKKDVLIFYEQLAIDAFIIRYGKENIYNICLIAYSTLGRKCSEETKRKIGEKSKGRWIGKRHTKETKEKISISNIGKNKGKKHTKEAKKKMSEKRKGKKFSEEHKVNLSKAIKQYWVIRKKYERKN